MEKERENRERKNGAKNQRTIEFAYLSDSRRTTKNIGSRAVLARGCIESENQGDEGKRQQGIESSDVINGEREIKSW